MMQNDTRLLYTMRQRSSIEKATRARKFKSFPLLLVLLGLQLFIFNCNNSSNNNISFIVQAQRSPDVTNVIYLHQHDFDAGTVILNEPGIYVLQEDIIFCPNGPTKSNSNDNDDDTSFDDDSSTSNTNFIADAFQPNFPATKYDINAFALGYFAAICIIGNDIEVRLNSYSIQQCSEHLLMQRFFATIELALQPFTTGEGPHEFVGNHNAFQSSSNITISGPGTLHRSSHHCT
jgi:hypothetical protein